MDLSTLVDYEKLHPVDVLHPHTDAPIGLKLWMRSIDSAQAEKVLLENTDRNIATFAKQKIPTAAQGKKAELERTAACVARWEWVGDANFDGKVPELSMETAIAVFDKAPWIERQARRAADTIANFITS